MNETHPGPSRGAVAAVWAVAAVIGVVVGLLTSDVILGVIAGAPCVAIGTGLLRLWTGGGTARPRHP
jgi:hypothetical protein